MSLEAPRRRVVRARRLELAVELAQHHLRAAVPRRVRPLQVISRRVSAAEGTPSVARRLMRASHLRLCGLFTARGVKRRCSQQSTRDCCPAPVHS